MKGAQDKVEARIDADLIGNLIAQTPTAVAVSVVSFGLMIAPIIAEPAAPVWCGAYAGALLLRILIWQGWRRAQRPRYEPKIGSRLAYY